MNGGGRGGKELSQNIFGLCEYYPKGARGLFVGIPHVGWWQAVCLLAEGNSVWFMDVGHR